MIKVLTFLVNESLNVRLAFFCNSTNRHFHIISAFMLVREGQRQEGASTIEDSPGDCIENVDCIINRRVVHSHGSLYLQDT